MVHDCPGYKLYLSFQNFWQTRVAWEIDTYPSYYIHIYIDSLAKANFHIRLIFFFKTIALLSCKMGHVLYVGHLSNILSSKAESQGKFHSFMEWNGIFI